MSSREDSSLLSEIREPFWSYYSSLTFVVHSQLRIVMPVLARYLRKEHLVTDLAGYLNEEEESLFMTQEHLILFVAHARIL